MRGALGRLTALLLLATPLAAPAAQDRTGPAVVDQQPVACRVTFVDGRLALRRPGATGTRNSEAGPGQPAAAGASFGTDARSRAEIRIGASPLDIAADTRLDIVALTPQFVELGLPQGRIRLHLRSGEAARKIEIDLPRGGLWLAQPGEYDIAAGTAQQPTRISVFAGGARFIGGGIDTQVRPQESVSLIGVNPIVASFAGAGPDEFVAWGRWRDDVEVASPATEAPASGTSAAGAAPRPAPAAAEPEYRERRHGHVRYRVHFRHEHVHRRHWHRHYARSVGYGPPNPLGLLFHILP